MPSKQDLRRRIRSVRSTQQLTRAMKMVSAAKLRRAQARVLEARPYAAALDHVLGTLAAQVSAARHRLMAARPEADVTLVVVTADKGLCGALNANVLRQAMVIVESGRWPKVGLVLIGRRGIDFFRRRARTPVAAYAELMHDVTPDAAFAVARELTHRFVRGDTDAVYLLYTRFRSIIRYEVSLERLLPIEPPKPAAGEVALSSAAEPSPQALVEAVLPRSVEFRLLRALLDAQAAEQASRMTAMDAASKNAGEMIDRLTLTYNRARQAAITKELIEIVSGAQALAER